MSKVKLFIQIPCLNEEKTLPAVIAGLPRKIEGIDEIYILVIDDGSTDKTVETAKRLGIDYIIKNNYNLGLAKTFCKGIEVSLALGADIIVNIDGDNQYKGADIAKLIKPICKKQTDIVIGCRNINVQKEFSLLKKVLQKVGSKIVCRLSNINIPDTTSGFRALSSTAARRIVIRCTFSYTLEMLCQAKRIGLKTDWTSIETNPKTREPRLFKSNFEYIYQQSKILIMVFLQYYPLGFFIWLATASFSISVLTGLFKLYFSKPWSTFKPDILLYFGLFIAILSIFAGLIGSILASLHLLLIDVRSRIRRTEFNQTKILRDFDMIVSPEFFRWIKTKKAAEESFV